MVKTLVVDNFRGSWTDFPFGDINSGKAWSSVSAGYNPFQVLGVLTWSNTPEQIDPTGSVITDLIMAAKQRVESNVMYVYAIGHTGRLYKIQVNDPTTYNPNYDNPVLLATLTVNSPTFTRGGSMEFFGATERIYIGHDKGVTRINFDGTGEAFVGALGSYTQTVPRPLKQFIGKLYFANGTNIGEIDSTASVTTYTKLSPAFPDNTQVRDLDVSTDGTYLHSVVSRLALPNLLSSTQTTDRASSSDSYIFKWNGVDIGYTSYVSYSSFSVNANKIFSTKNYLFGYNMWGPAVYNEYRMMWNLTGTESPLVNAVTNSGDLTMWLVPTAFNGVQEADLLVQGSYSVEFGEDSSFYDMMFLNATSPETDIIQVPYLQSISNTGIGASSNGYSDNVFSNSKVYFSTLETSASPTTAYRFYKWITSSYFNIANDNPLHGDNPPYYQTPIQMFSKKITVKEVRIYGTPWIANNSFKIDLVGSDFVTNFTPIPGGSKTFDTADSSLTIGNDFAWYTPNCAPTYALGVGVSNLGTTNNTITKIEVDYDTGGK